MTAAARGQPGGGQLTLDLGHRPALSGDDFLVAPSNADAVKWLDAWPRWPGPALIVTGPRGSGKTHLAQVFQAQGRARAVSAADLSESTPPNVLGEAVACVLDNADEAVAAGLEEPILHLYNHVAERGGHLMVTAKTPPKGWGLGLPDLLSRLNAAPQATIGAPEDGLLAAVLIKQFMDRQLRIDADVIPFLVARMERSFAAAQHLVAAIDQLSLQERRNITVPLVKRVIEAQDKS